MSSPATKEITLSLGDIEVSLGEKAPGGTQLFVKDIKHDSKFAFEFNGSIDDKFEIKRYYDSVLMKQVTEIWVKRGDMEKAENIPLVKISHK